MAPDADPYAAPRAESRGRGATLLTLLVVLLLVFVVAKVAGTMSANRAVFEERYAVAEGNAVSVLFTIRDAETGEVIASTAGASGTASDGRGDHEPEVGDAEPLTFAVGSGDSGYGEDFEGALVGHYAGEQVRRGPVDGEEAFGGWERVPQTFPRAYGPFELEQELNQQFITAYEQQVGPLSEGDTIRVFRDFPWSQTVVQRGNESVLVRHLVQDGDTYPWNVPPSDLVLDVDEGERTFRVRFDVAEGTTFGVLPNSPSSLFFQPGSYRVEDVNSSEIVLQYSAAPDPEAVGRDVIVEIKILNIEK